MYYYPRIPTFQACLAYTSTNVLSELFLALISENLIPITAIAELSPLSGSKLQTYLTTKANVTDKFVQRFKEFFESGYKKTLSCGVSCRCLMNKYLILTKSFFYINLNNKEYGQNDFLYKPDVPHYTPTQDYVGSSSCPN
jgi:hypothetical protein